MIKLKKNNSIKPFWSWNDTLEKEELEKQITAMKNNGIEGFFMHARGGLKTKYLGDEWFQMVEACLDKAEQLGMQAWIYDENGWPSGSANGQVSALGVKHQQKMLKWEIYHETVFDERIISEERILITFQKTDSGFLLTDRMEQGVYVFYYEVNPHYIDPFSEETIAEFLHDTHEKYYDRFGERFGKSLEGFFTDEPQYRLSPWSFCFQEEFEKRYGYELLPVLPLLFFDESGYEAVRSDYWEMVSELFRLNFIKQMYDWCTEHHCKLTGHMMNENNLHSQMKSTGGVMACYEYFHEPGMDHLGRKTDSPAQPKQVGSVAAQLGRKTMTETFALCGWDVSLNELKWIAQWQYLNGVTSLCPHLQGYSLRGSRKRDYPPSLFVQLPWFEYSYKEFADYFTYLGNILDSAKDVAPVLLLHPMHSAYILHNPYEDSELMRYSERFDKLTEEFNAKHILHHYGDETIIEHYGSVSIERDIPILRVGKCEYSMVILPHIINLTHTTANLLLEFVDAGGKVICLGSLPEYVNGRKTELLLQLREKLDICENVEQIKSFCAEFCRDAIACTVYDKDTDHECENVHITLKKLDNGQRLLYLINNEKTERRIRIEAEGDKTITEINIAEYGSELFTLEEKAQVQDKSDIVIRNIIPDRIFQISECDNNALTLDKCNYRIDDGQWHSELAVINLQNKVLEMQRSCKVDMKFIFCVEEEFDFFDMMVCIENPEKFNIYINDKHYEFKDEGFFIDTAIRKSRIGEFVKVGENTITLSCVFTQSPELYYAKFTPGVHESVLNKLTYDTELESIYLTGSFGVEMKGDYAYGEKRCIHGGKKFCLKKMSENVDITEITTQGFWFFSGKMALAQKLNIDKQNDAKYLLKLSALNAPAARVFMNSEYVGSFMFTPFELDLTEYILDGENELTIQLFSGNRNLLGPHHKPEGESYSVGPDSFGNKHGWTDDRMLPAWTDRYNFVKFGCGL